MTMILPEAIEKQNRQAVQPLVVAAVLSTSAKFSALALVIFPAVRETPKAGLSDPPVDSYDTSQDTGLVPASPEVL